VSICTDLYRNAALMPRRVRAAECSQFENQLRWINFYCAFNLTPDPGDNEPIYGAWTAGDMPVSVAWQDVDDRGGDLLFVASGNRVFVLDWERYRDEINWETYVPIYRRLTLGPIPGNRDAQEDGPYDLAALKRFRRLSFQLAAAPTADGSQYKISVQEDGAEAATAAQGYRTTQRHGEAKVALRGYTFLVTLEHDADEDFPLAWWQAEWESLGGRRADDRIVTS
jgi:hypothetical protein